MTALGPDLLTKACSAGGPSCLSAVTPLRPAAGEFAAVAPAKFAAANSREHPAGVYWYEQRRLNDEWRTAVVIDSKQSQANRAETALRQAIEDGDALLSRLPRMVVTYERDGVTERYTDLDLPHRAFDGHFRAGTINGTDTVATDQYRAIRDANPANARALLEASPLSLVFGSWDSSRKARQARWRSAVVGEIIGFCEGERPGRRGGARVDPVGMQVNLRPASAVEMADAQESEISVALAKKIRDGAKKAKGGALSGSEFGLGGIPPSLAQLGGVACDTIFRSTVLSFAALRQIRFGGSPEADAACRALLAALALNGVARAYSELALRANCDLVEAGPVVAEIDRRWGETERVDLPDVPAADALLAECLTAAEASASIDWSGQVIEITGNPAIVAGAVDAHEDDAG